MRSARFTKLFLSTVTSIALAIAGLTAAPAQAGAVMPMTLKYVLPSDGLTVELPLYGTVNAVINWGDASGTTTAVSPGFVSHVYASSGTYTISVTGSVTHYGNKDTMASGVQYLSEVLGFGGTGVTSLEGAFYGASTLTAVPVLLPASVTNLGMAFSDATIFNQDLSTWSVLNVTDISSMFRNASAFNQPIGSWNTASLTDMTYAFVRAKAFNQDISGWDISKVTSLRGVFLEASAFNQPLDAWDVSNVTNLSFTFYQANAFNQDISAWDVSNVTDLGGTFAYATAFNQDISAWDTSAATRTSNMFTEAKAFNQPLDSWDMSQVTEMQMMFAGASAFNQPLNSWDTSKVTNMTDMFFSAYVFNSDISAWDVSSVTTMSRMFTRCLDFNQDLSGWDTGNVTAMNQMFDSTSFNYDISGWDVSSATNLEYMFLNNTDFNQPLAGWDISSATSLRGIFQGATAFDQPLAAWDTSMVTNFASAFDHASSFNQDLNTWDVSSGTDFSYMFDYASAFQGDISGWDVSSANSLHRMFARSHFNQPIDAWDVSSVADFSSMFYNNDAFNQPIGGWDTSSATNFESMFEKTWYFNMDLSGWDVSQVTNYANMFKQGALSKAHYSAFLNHLADPDSAAQSGMSIRVDSNYLCGAEAGRDHLVNDLGWTISDWGKAECKTTQTITFPAPSSVAKFKVRKLQATASSGLPIRYSKLSGPCTLVGPYVVATGLGTCAVTAKQDGDDTYSDAVQVVRWVQISSMGFGEFIFEANGADSGTAPVDATGPHSNGDQLTAPGAGDLTREGYEFTGWNTDPDGWGQHYDVGATLTIGDADVLLFAQWVMPWGNLVTYDLNGADAGTQPVDSARHGNGEQVVVISSADIVRAGYLFGGWNTAADGSGTTYQDGDWFWMGDTAVELFALWIPDVTTVDFTFTAAGSSSPALGTRSIDLGDEISLLSATEVTRSGYTLVGWNTAADGSGYTFEPGALFTVSGEVTELFAVWQKNAVARPAKHLIVGFGALTAKLSKAEKARLRTFYLNQLRGHAAGLTIRVTGYVQKIGSTANDRSLSLARAKAVATYLRVLGLKATVKLVVGKSTGGTSTARRASLWANWSA